MSVVDEKKSDISAGEMMVDSDLSFSHSREQLFLFNFESLVVECWYCAFNFQPENAVRQFFGREKQKINSKP
jgi:hypothetical protein